MKKKKSPYEWPFSKWRQTWISEGDRLVTEAKELFNHGACPVAACNRAAKMLTKAARFYRQAGVGFLAKATWNQAADCYEAVGDGSMEDYCEKKAEAIPEYWHFDEVFE